MISNFLSTSPQVIRKHFVVLFLICSISKASEGLEPAHFGEARQDFLQSLKLPILQEGEQLIIRCGSTVSPWGRILTTACYETNGAITKSREIGKALRRALLGKRISPAKVDGKGVEIWFNFSLVYRRVKGAPKLLLLENHAFRSSELTESYIAAQRFNTGSWGLFCKRTKKPIFAQVLVSADGSLLGSKISADDQPELCTARILNAINQSRFIPAQMDGKPVNSTFIEIFYFSQLSQFR